MQHVNVVSKETSLNRCFKLRKQSKDGFQGREGAAMGGISIRTIFWWTKFTLSQTSEQNQVIKLF
jgi:hypothetical protein